MTQRPISFEQAKAQYVHRYTVEHVPQWAMRPHSDGLFYAPQFSSDREWYDNTLFPGEGHISKRSKYCFTSGQTWPHGQWLTGRFARGAR